jgi:arylsulfatase A-like enzyme
MHRKAMGRKALLAIGLCLFVFWGTGRAAGAEQHVPPHIVYIIADDLGYGDVQCLNPQRGKIKTPHLDRLAAEGMTFTDAHSGSSVCTPTRYGLLTGRYAWRTRLQSGVLNGYAEPLIAADRLTVPALLKQHGYHTACIGKWHLGFTVSDGSAGQAAGVGAVSTDGPVTRGFDTFLGFQHARSMQAFFENDQVTARVEPIEMLPKLARLAAGYVTQRARQGTPFFLYYALSSPHTPIVPSPAWQGKSGLGDYGDFVMETDWAVGEVLAALDRAGIARDTLVIFTSDNGCSPAAGTGKLEAQGHYPSADLRGYKSDIWDGGHRVPFFVRWPGRVKPASTNAALLCLTDLMATVAEIAGAEIPDNAGEDSFSFLPEILGTGRSQRTSAVHHSINGRFAIRDGATKLALCSGSGGWSKEPTEGDVQLYDLSTDLGERTNLAGSRSDDVRRLTALLDQLVAGGRSTAGRPQSNDVEVRPVKGTSQPRRGRVK